MASGWLGWDWGTVPAWVGTVVTGGSALIAAFSYRRSVRDREQEQASKVAAWTSVTYDSGKRKRLLYVSNASDAPIYELTVRPSNARDVMLQELQAQASATFELSDDESPAASSARVAKISAWVLEVTVVSETVVQEPTELQFRDALGRWWQRSSNGRLLAIRARTVRGVLFKSPTIEIRRTSE